MRNTNMRKSLTLTICLLLVAYIGQAQLNRYIVEFNDKAGTPFSLGNPSAYLSQRAVSRRVHYSIAIDSTDLPITPRYLDSLRAAGAVTILNISKWLNQVAIQTTDAAAIARINNFSFVKGSTAVAPRTATAAGSPQNKFEEMVDITGAAESPAPELTNIYNYGQSYPQVHLHQGEFLHNHGFSGQGMQLAMLDAGFPNYPTIPTFDSVRINNRFLGTWDFVNNAANVNGFNSHGTQCLSTIAANNPGTFVGTAPQTSFYLYRTEDALTEYPIEEQNLVAALERADSLGVNMASISLGYSTFDNTAFNHTYADMNGNTTMAARGADWAARKGMLLVIANGNDGGSSWHYLGTPADADSVLSVGAVSSAGVIGGFSSYGPSSDGQVKPSVAAVGVNAVVANPANGVPFQSSGTSFACPNMAGLTTCLWQAFPESNNMGIISALQESASQFASPDDRKGYGIPDMKKAFVILLKRLYSQEIKQAGCSTLLKWTAKSSGNTNFVVERKLPADADYVAIQTVNGEGAFVNDTFNFADNLSAFITPTNISYRIKMNIDSDTSFYFTPVTINHINTCNTYTFIGNGNWNIAANWAGNIVPPAILPAGSTIIIDPVISGEAVLNATQQVQAGAYFEVRPGKKLLVPGNLVID
ncbi:MAG: peptidase S8 [Chitinophagaceae bacterium]|nr:MAG: peptidase S8 [Chitinophagaceae bacterium]